MSNHKDRLDNPIIPSIIPRKNKSPSTRSSIINNNIDKNLAVSIEHRLSIPSRDWIVGTETLNIDAATNSLIFNKHELEITHTGTTYEPITNKRTSIHSDNLPLTPNLAPIPALIRTNSQIHSSASSPSKVTNHVNAISPLRGHNNSNSSSPPSAQDFYDLNCSLDLDDDISPHSLINSIRARVFF